MAGLLTVDVRDMQCAQALAVAAQAMQRLASGSILELLCNADDVREDLLVWARHLRHGVLSTEGRNRETRLSLQKR